MSFDCEYVLGHQRWNQLFNALPELARQVVTEPERRGLVFLREDGRKLVAWQEMDYDMAGSLLRHFSEEPGLREQQVAELNRLGSASRILEQLHYGVNGVCDESLEELATEPKA